jgi:hypothetical protein
MPATLIKMTPCDRGMTVSTAVVNGGVTEEVLQSTADELTAVTELISLIRGGGDTDLAVAVLSMTETPSAPQKAGLLGYIEAINAEDDTSTVETAIAEL